MYTDYQYRPPYWQNPNYMIPDESELNPPGFSAIFRAELEANEKKARNSRDVL